MRKMLLIAVAALSAVSVFAQYDGEPWNGTPWKFTKLNVDNFQEYRVDGYLWDIGTAETTLDIDPAATAAQVCGTSIAAPRENIDTSDDLRKIKAEEDGKTLDATEDGLRSTYSCFTWKNDGKLHFRDAGGWYRYTVQFEEGGLYQIVMRGSTTTNLNNFKVNWTLYKKTESGLEEIWNETHNNPVESGTGPVEDLGVTPTGDYEDLPEAPVGNSWYKWTHVFDFMKDLDASATYVIQFWHNASPATGGFLGEFTFASVPASKPTITSIATTNIEGCGGSVSAGKIAVAATPETTGAAVEYKYAWGTYVVQDWTTEASIDVMAPGLYTVQAREVGLVLTHDTVVEVNIVNCDNAPYGGTAQSLPGVIEAENFDNGGLGVAYMELSSPFENVSTNAKSFVWDIRNNEESGRMGVDLTIDSLDVNTTIDSVNYGLCDMGNFNGVKGGEWVKYTIDVENSADYALKLKYFTNATNTGKDIQLEFFDASGALVDTFKYNVRGTWDIFGGKDFVPVGYVNAYRDTVYNKPITLPAGTYEMVLYSNLNNMHIDNMTFSIVSDLAYDLYLNTNSVEQSVPVRISATKNSTVYIVPTSTGATSDEIIAASIASIGVVASDTANLVTGEIPVGTYKVYAIDLNKNISNGVDLEIKELVRPIITIVDATASIAAPIFKVTVSQGGMLYFVPDGTVAIEDSIIAASLISTEVVADVQVEVKAGGIDFGKYLFYAINADKTISEGAKCSITETAIKENNAETVNIYPTIVKNMLYVNTAEAVDITIINIAGQIVKSYNKVESGQINVAELDKGLYFVNCRLVNGVLETKRIIKQ